MGVAQSAGIAGARVVGPIIAGALFAGFGRNTPFLWGAALVVAAVGNRLAAAPRRRGASRRPTAKAGRSRRMSAGR